MLDRLTLPSPIESNVLTVLRFDPLGLLILRLIEGVRLVLLVVSVAWSRS